jgi:catechol 2,3-dioxygenase-like lactoylglutathione lyase family enzyme
MNFQGVVMNVADLDRSIEFYREVLDFSLLSQNEQIATVCAPGSEQPQVIVLRAFGSGRIGGSRHTGLRAFVLEVESTDQLEAIATELDSRRVLVSRRDQSEWTAVVGRDLDGVALVVACVAGPGRITETNWSTLYELLYGIGEEWATSQHWPRRSLRENFPTFAWGDLVRTESATQPGPCLKAMLIRGPDAFTLGTLCSKRRCV